jgi:cell division transport system ATP-binding protein
MERGGFEPPKALPTDLQSAPFGRSGTSPNVNLYYITAFRRNQHLLSVFLGAFANLMTEIYITKKSDALPRTSKYVSLIECFGHPHMIQTYHVYKTYPGGTTALSDISIRVNRGEFVFLTGPSGAGKSTLLKILFCQEKASSGEILVDGINVSKIDRKRIPMLRRRIGMIFQDFKLLNNKTVFENIAFALEILGCSQKEIRRRAWQALRLVGLHEKMDFHPLRISGGEQQRVAIARALVKDPPLILADEPTGNLDPNLTADIINVLMLLNTKGTTVVIATHDKDLIQRYRKRVVSLSQGTVV